MSNFDIGAAVEGLARKGISAKNIIDHLSGGGYGGNNMNSDNIRTVQGQTDYNYQLDQAQGINDRLTNQQLGQADDLFYRNESANNARRQQNLINDVATADVTNRAQAAQNVLNSYNQARQTNAQFLSNLATAGLTQR